MAVDASTRPLRQFLLYVLRGEFRLQTERMPTQVDGFTPAALGRKLEPVTKTGKRIVPVEAVREFAGVVVLHQRWPGTW